MVGEPTGFWKGFFNAFSSTGWLYSVLYLLLIVVFAYFYMTIQYNPIEMANNLRTNNGTIPGIRPGRPTAEFISKILSKITLIGAIFLAFVAILPILYSNLTGMYGLSMGGHVRHHHGRRCAGDCKADRISDDDASLQGLP